MIQLHHKIPNIMPPHSKLLLLEECKLTLIDVESVSFGTETVTRNTRVTIERQIIFITYILQVHC